MRTAVLVLTMALALGARAQDAPASDALLPAPAPDALVPPAPAAQAPVVDDAPPIVAPAAPPGDMPTAPAASSRKVLRLAVQQVEATEVSDRLRAIFTASLVTELRKLNGVSVVGMDEVKALLEQEAMRQTIGCSEDGCLAELADALGADVLVLARIARLGGEHVASFRRVDARDGKTLGVDRRFAAGNGEEFLAAIGPAVAELFPDIPLREGTSRGVDKEVGRRLNPPPIAPWVLFTTAGIGAGALVVGGGAGVAAWVLAASVQRRIDESVRTPVRGAELKTDYDVAQVTAYAADGLLVSGAVVLAGAGVLALFTDFWGYGDAPPE